MASGTDIRVETSNSWVEISIRAIENNVAVFREIVGRARRLVAVVKADAYGHGMVDVARTTLASGADWLGVFWASEGLALRAADIAAPVLVLGPTPRALLPRTVQAGLRLTVASLEGLREVGAIDAARDARLHLKLETGTNRQGITAAQLPEVARLLAETGMKVEGAYTHYADIEDTTDHSFAEQQLQLFNELLERLAELHVDVPLPHTACTAAAILFPDTYFAAVRVGIGLYGLWPSKETQVSAQALGRNRLGLEPVMTWKTRVVQLKTVPAGGFVGYGRTFRATRETRLAVLPVGYADGYDRGLSNVAHVLVRGVRAPLLGRVCMNLSMIDVTDVAGVAVGDEVVLLGRQGDELIRAEDLARLAGTINYEIVTRAAPGAPRVLVD